MQGRYKAIIVDADEYALELSRYIHLNPVRVGNVDNPKDYRWSSCGCYTGYKAVPSWLKTDFILGYFGNKKETAQKKYRQFVNDLIDQEYSSPLLATVASTILGREEFVCEIQNCHLKDKHADRELPGLRKLTDRPLPENIVKAVHKAYPADERLAKKMALYLCHRHSGAKLKELGDLFQLSESGVAQASKRFKQDLDGDKQLKGKIQEVAKGLNLSNV
ncbi:hypothetical protein [Geotalea sp. SG265]|uniref:hypothetical protein n=1 Tax=Geotalea sp. SG265 TaxID=2922867 RepID=UPI001FAFEE60|nr:hypothetical protein [Geotalea sp. SG265]